MEQNLALSTSSRMVWTPRQTATQNGRELAGGLHRISAEAAAGDGWRCAVHSDDIGALLGLESDSRFWLSRRDRREDASQ